jgi:hypothetical protein
MEKFAFTIKSSEISNEGLVFVIDGLGGKINKLSIQSTLNFLLKVFPQIWHTNSLLFA